MGQNLESPFLHLAHLIRSINDPEHPLTLEELNVVEQVRIQVSDPESTVAVAFTPTIPHCSMATLIGLSIKVKLLRSLPQRFKVSWSRVPKVKQLLERGDIRVEIGRIRTRRVEPRGNSELM